MNRQIFNILALVALCAQLGAVEVYRDGDKSVSVVGEKNVVKRRLRNIENKSVSVFGEINVGIGYGSTLTYPIIISNGVSNYSIQDAYNNTKNSFMLGLQKDSRVGISFDVSGVFGEATLGLDNSTVYGEIPYFRQLYAGYDFGKGGRILAGQTELNTSMGGFISDISNEEDGLWGYGAPRNSVRRLQVRYEIAGFSIGVSANDVVRIINTGSFYDTATETRILYEKRSIPKISLAYEYNSDRLRAKIAGSYVCAGHCNNNSNNTTKSKHIVYLTAGIRPYFNKSYLSFVLSYGLNSHYTEDGLVAYSSSINQNITGYGNLQYISYNPDDIANDSDRNIYATAFEFGHHFTDKIALKIGLGYQISTLYMRGIGKYDILHSVGGFLQVPCKINDYFTLIPQTGSRIILRSDITNTNPNEYKLEFNVNAAALLLMKFTF